MPSADDFRDLVYVDIDTAVRLKFERGRMLHGDDWKGQAPALELHAELLDAVVYASLAMQTSTRPEHQEVFSEIIARLAELRRGMVTLILSLTEDELNGWTLPKNH